MTNFILIILGYVFKDNWETPKMLFKIAGGTKTVSDYS